MSRVRSMHAVGNKHHHVYSHPLAHVAHLLTLTHDQHLALRTSTRPTHGQNHKAAGAARCRRARDVNHEQTFEQQRICMLPLHLRALTSNSPAAEPCVSPCCAPDTMS